MERGTRVQLKGEIWCPRHRIPEGPIVPNDIGRPPPCYCDAKVVRVFYDGGVLVSTMDNADYCRFESDQLLPLVR